MAGGSSAPTGVSKERAEQYQGRVTAYVIVACIVAAVGGSLFGYDIGISGKSFLYIKNMQFQVPNSTPSFSAQSKEFLSDSCE